MIKSLQSDWYTNAGKIRCRPLGKHLLQPIVLRRADVHKKTTHEDRCLYVQCGVAAPSVALSGIVAPGTFTARRHHTAYALAWTRHLKVKRKRLMYKCSACFKRSRIAFDLPELLEIQRASFNQFVQHDIPDLFSQLAPIRVEGDNMVVELHLDGNNFQLITPDDTPQNCILKLKTYSCKLYIEAKIVYKTPANQVVYSTQGEWVLIGHLPLMTKRGHFIINGSPRVIVHQVVRSPGIYFQQVLDKDEKQRVRFYGDIIPRRGVWLRLQTTKKGKIEAKLKKGKKVSADMLQRCLQLIERLERENPPYSGQQFSFEEHQSYLSKQEHWAVGPRTLFSTDLCKTSSAIGIPKSDVLKSSIKMPIPYRNGVLASARTKNAALKGLPSTLPLKGLNNRLGFGKLTPTCINGLSTPSCEKTESTVPLVAAMLQNCDVRTPGVSTPGRTRRHKNGSADALDTLTGKFPGLGTDEINALNSVPEEKALLYTYDKLYRPAEDKEREEMSKKGKNSSSSNNTLTDRRLKLKRCYKNIFSTFKEEGRYDLSFLGREKINTKLGIYVPNNQLTALDIYAASNWLHRLTKGEKNVDDIDHFQNRRIRTSGELLYAQFENGVDRLKRLTWNKLKRFVHLQAVQTAFLDLQDLGKLSADVKHARGKINKTTFFTRFRPEQTAIDNKTTFGYARTVTGTKSYPQIKPLNASLPPSQTDLRSPFSPKHLSKSYTLSEIAAATTNPSLNGKNFYQAPLLNRERFWQTPLSLENFPALQKQRADRKRYHIRNTRYAGSAPLLELLIKQRHLLYRFGYPAQRRWIRRQEKEPLPQSHTNRGIKTLDSKKGIFVKNPLSANSSQSDSVSTTQAKLALPSLKEFLSTKPLNGALRELFGSNPLSQYMDQTNPLAEITHKRRMSSLGVGGVSRESAGMAIRGIHPTHYGRICPIETPEGKNAGLVNSLALYAKIDNKGFVETPYYRVVKGQVQHELGFTFFSAKQESVNNFKIAPSDLQQSWSNMLATDSVPVRVADNLLDVFKKIDSYHVDCIGIAPVQMISVATSLIPFLEHNDANRALMGSNMQRQAVPLMIPERAIVGTGLESLVVAESGHVLQSKLTGFVSYVSANRIVVDSLCWTPQNVSPYTPTRKRFFQDIMPQRKELAEAWRGKLATAAATPFKEEKNLRKNLSFYTRKRSGQMKSSVDGTGNAYRRGQACSCIFPPLSISGWPLRSNNSSFFEKSDRVSFAGARAKWPNLCDSLSQTAFRPTSIRASTFLLVKRRYHQAAQLPLYHISKNFNCGRANTSGFAANAFFQSMWYSTTNSKTAQKLASSVHVVSNFDRSNQDTCLTQRALVREGNWVQKGDILTDCSASDQGELAVGKNILVAYIPWEGYNFEDAIVISERLVKEHVYTSLHIERYDFNAQDVKEGSEWFTNDLPGVTGTKIKHLDEFGLPKIGSFVNEGDILLGKIRYSNIKPTTPYERLLCDILGENNFSARDSSLYVPKGVHARVIKRKILTFFDDPSRVRSKRDKSPKLVHIFLGEKRAIQVGDKMSGRHGNKGVVATILPRQDMPYLPDGTAIDIILNPLGVPSRMNVGQVFESLLGLAGTYLAQHFKIMCFDELYGVEASQSLVYLKLYQARLQSGQNWLFQVDFPGKTRLIDGRSGQCFDQWITVGKAYMLKLIHMVNEKIHARATGPYALITQQPLRGRSQKGGQRLGEMEVWALEGFGAAYTLQELLTKKSDDMVGRKQVASAILPRPISILDIVQPANRAQENRFVLGQPEIFKVLMCELQALCLDVGVYSLTTESFQRSFLSRVNHI